MSLYDDLPESNKPFANINIEALQKEEEKNTPKKEETSKPKTQPKNQQKIQPKIQSTKPNVQPKKDVKDNKKPKKQKLLVPVSQLIRNKIQSEVKPKPKTIQPSVSIQSTTNVQQVIQEQYIPQIKEEDEYDPKNPNTYDDYLRWRKTGKLEQYKSIPKREVQAEGAIADFLNFLNQKQKKEEEVEEEPKKKKQKEDVIENSRVILLKNLVSRGEIDDYLYQEVKDECSKYGRVLSIYIYEVEDGRVSDDEAVRIFVQFASSESAARALDALDGRFFANRQIKCEFYDEIRFINEDYY